MGHADYLKLGDWNARCDRCGFKFKGSELQKTWQGFWTCTRCWEPRQPQDFVRGIVENPTPPFVRDPAPDYVAVCTPNGRTAICDFAVCDCCICDFTDPAFDPAVTEAYP